jgi:hypothetical protein
MDAAGSESLNALTRDTVNSGKRSRPRWREIAARSLLAGLVASAAGLWVMMVL